MSDSPAFLPDKMSDKYRKIISQPARNADIQFAFHGKKKHRARLLFFQYFQEDLATLDKTNLRSGNLSGISHKEKPKSHSCSKWGKSVHPLNYP